MVYGGYGWAGSGGLGLVLEVIAHEAGVTFDKSGVGFVFVEGGGVG